MSAFDLKGRKVLVTGGARGLGEGIARSMAAAGAGVVIADLLEKEGVATAASIAKTGAKASFVHLDVTDDSSWEKGIAQAAKSLGGLDTLVNNAGIEITSLVIDTDPKELKKMLDVNIVGTALGMKWGFRQMRKGGPAGGTGGCIINLSSVAATIAFPGIAGYSGTKSAVDRMTRIAAQESGKLGYGIRVNCIYPGLVATQMGVKLAQDCVQLGLFKTVEEAIGGVVGLTPMGRLGEVQDMADGAVFLASDAARFITGVGLPIDGGMGM
jgi:3alpha(or 20beta)-hydroxysteroid dehydrogenase